MWPFFLMLLINCQSSSGYQNSDQFYKSNQQNKLLQAYPDHVALVEKNLITWKDGTQSIYDDGKTKSIAELIENPDVEDQFHFKYTIGNNFTILPEIDPGRIRNEEFFKKMYGNTREEVEQNLVPISWLPTTLGKKLSVTAVNGVSDKLQQISNELETMTHLHQYLIDPGGTYNWRVISDTQRLSPHSFGIAIDINVSYADYWKWKVDQGGTIEYINKIPFEIVEIFEKYGFIWGGKWYHFDTMHFEYRPELML